MKELIRLGFLNIFRNKRRTFLTALVIGIGLCSLIVQNGLLKGMINHIFETASETFIGGAQIHNNEFLGMQDVNQTIHNKDEVIKILQSQKDIKGYSQRVISLALLSSPRNGVSVQLYGIDFNNEKKVSKIAKALGDENFKFKERSIIIGSKLKDLLEVDINDHIVITVADAKENDLVQDMFNVEKIFTFGDSNLDKYVAFISKDKLDNLLNLDGAIHEIAISFNTDNVFNPLTPKLTNQIDSTDNQILSVGMILPSLQAMLDFSKYGTAIVMIFVFFLVIFIIMNTLFMSLFERIKEFGVLKAIGTTPRQIFYLILIEASALAFVSIVIGGVVGLIVNFIFMKTGINYAGIDIGGVTLATPIYPVFDINQITLYPLAIFIFIVLIAIYPGIYAARIMPDKALRKNG